MSNNGLRDAIRKWAARAHVQLVDESATTLCEDCGNVSDLGMKCRPCYAQWSKLLWQDVPQRQVELLEIARELNAAPVHVRLAIANGRPASLAGSHAALYLRIKAALDGPFKAELEVTLSAIRTASTLEPKGRRTASSEVE